MSSEDRYSAEELLAHASWLRTLALRIVRDAEVADDLVQETYAASLRRAPATGQPVRGWLAKVLINTLRMRIRSEGRRTTREQATLLLVEDVPATDELVARAEAQRMLVDLVLRLDEPYRSTVLLHFCEGVALADIARAQGVAAGTARWRLKVALDQLREWLDARPGGRKQWVAGLAAISKGVLVAHKTSRRIALALLILLLLVGGGLIAKRTARRSDVHGAAGAGAASGGASSSAAAPSAPSQEAGVPAWLAQSGVAARRIAGRVTFEGKPVAGAVVELASLASETGLAAAPHRTTGAAGEFDFGPQAALAWSVRASAPGHTAASVEVDLREPHARPAPDHLEVALGACNAALFGTVRDASGGTIASARLARLPFGEKMTVPGGPAVTSDDRGAYELCIEARWPGWVGIEVSAHGYGTIVYTAIVPGRVKADFALVPEATIVGHVIREDTGAPVAGAYVFMPVGQRGTERTGWRAAFADDTGHFRIDRVAPGPHVLIARGDGMVISRGTPVVVEAGETSADIELRLSAASTVRGVVRASGKPVAGARIAAIPVGDGRASPMAISQDDGSFTLREVPLGDVRFAAAPYAVVSPATFHVGEAEHDGVVLEVESLGTIVGHVVRNKQPVPGASIDIHGPNEGDLDRIRSDANGRFEANGLQPGAWTLYASNERAGSFGGPVTVRLARGESQEVTIDVTYAAAISGRVIDQNGAPVSGVTALFRNTSSDDVGLATTTVDGTFRAATMTGGGQYRPTVRRTAASPLPLRPVGGGEFPLVTLSGPDAEVSGIVLAVQLDRLTIAGKVVDTDGAPVADARVTAELVDADLSQRAFGGLQDAAATTDVDGKFAIANLLAGDYLVRARSTAGTEAALAGVAAGRSDVTVVLPTPGSIEGTLAGFTGAPQVSAVRQGSFSAPMVASIAPPGFVLHGLSPGRYVVAARTASEAASAEVEVTSGRTSHVTLTSHGSGGVSGRVIELRSGKPIEGITCLAVPRLGTLEVPGAPGDGVRTDASGGFSISSAPAGELEVWCGGLWRLYSDGLHLVTLSPGQQTTVEVRVVAWSDEATHTLASFGADVAEHVLVPTLADVRTGGPAAAAGFRNGDIITAVDATPTTELSPQGVWILIANRPPGSKVKLSVTRGGATVTGELVLREAQD